MSSDAPATAAVHQPAALLQEEFQWLRRTVKAASGIHLTQDRATVAATRIARRVRATGLRSFGEYIALVEQDASRRELWSMIDAVTVNQTCFYREAAHYPAYLGCLRERLRRNDTATVWSAGCASGEETFTLAMLAHSLVPAAAGRVRFLGTDISGSALARARAGVYDRAHRDDLPPLLRPLLEDAEDGSGRVRVCRRVRDTVSFALHNLVGVWQMRGPMDIIFCRNVLLYFDRPTQRRVINAFCDILAPGGYLFLGATETVAAGSQLRYLQPSMYRKPPEER